MFGINDQYDIEKAHLLPSLIAKVHNAKINNEKSIELWGSGLPRREFMCSADCADALLFLMQNYSGVDPINVGMGKDHTVTELAENVMDVLGVNLPLVFDQTKPDGIMRKLADSSKINDLGWHPKIPLKTGIQWAYQDYLAKLKTIKKKNLSKQIEC